MKMLEEHDSHFVCENAAGKPVVVAKRGLGKEMQERIRGSAKPVKMAEGGTVPNLPPEAGGAWADAYKAAWNQPDPVPMKAPEPVAAPAAATEPAPAATAPGPTPQQPAPEGLANPLKPWMDAYSAAWNQPGPNGEPPVGLANPLKPWADAYAAAWKDQPTGPAPATALADLVNKATAQPETASTATKTAAFSETKPLPVTPGTGAAPKPPGTPEFDKGIAEQRAGLADAAAVAMREGEAQAAAIDTAEKQKQALRDSFDQKMKAHQERSDALFNDVQNSKVDPKQFWTSKSTGSKVAASIGILLGGIGSGLTRGPNLALEQLNKSIEQDIDAQKAELGKKETLLSRYMEQGHDLQAAHQLAMADAKDAAAGQMAKISAQFGGPKAAAAAQQASGALRVQAQELRQQAEARSLDNQFKRTQISALGQQMAAQKQALQGQGAVDRVVAQLAIGGSKVDPAIIAQLPEKIRQNVVQLRDGTHALAYGEKGAESVRETNAAADDVMDAIDKARATRKKYGIEFGGEGAAEAKAIQARLIGSVNKLLRLGALDKGTQDLLQSLARDASEATTDKSFEASMRQLEGMVGSTAGAIENANLLRARKSTGFTARTAADVARR